jgi:hypothetical protein
LRGRIYMLTHARFTRSLCDIAHTSLEHMASAHYSFVTTAAQNSTHSHMRCQHRNNATIPAAKLSPQSSLVHQLHAQRRVDARVRAGGEQGAAGVGIVGMKSR